MGNYSPLSVEEFNWDFNSWEYIVYIVVPYPGKIFFFYNYFYSNNIDFSHSNSQTDTSVWQDDSLEGYQPCLLSRENKFMFIHLCYIAAFMNRYLYKFCFQIVILVIKGEQQSLAQWTDLGFMYVWLY